MEKKMGYKLIAWERVAHRGLSKNWKKIGKTLVFCVGGGINQKISGYFLLLLGQFLMENKMG